MEKIQPLIRGQCPVCKKLIMNKTKTEFINGGMEFWVKFSDGSQAQFSICDVCYSTITQEQLDDITKSQIVCWGIEIWRQMQWYYEQAVHLKIIKHTKEKNGLQDTPSENKNT